MPIDFKEFKQLQEENEKLEIFIKELTIINQDLTKELKSEKVKIKSLYGVSPDIFDATMMTFAYPVAAKIRGSRIRRINQSNIKRKSELTTIRRVSGTQKSMSSISVNVSH